MRKIYLFFISILFLFVSCESMVEKENAALVVPKVNSPELITLESGAVVEKRGDEYVWGGDMVLSPRQFELLNKTGDIFDETSAKFGATASIHQRFEGIPDIQTRATGIYPYSYNMWYFVPFIYGSNLSYFQRYSIRDALINIESMTNVRFYNLTGVSITNPSYDYIEFVKNDTVNNSYVGRKGGKQLINLTEYADVSVVMHEIGHAIGMLHEFQRIDRDSYVTIHSSNIKPEKEHNFKKRTTDYYIIGSYDFYSIMSYNSYTTNTSFVYNVTLPMYTKINLDTIYQGTTYSNLDREWVNTFYYPFIARSDTYNELASTVYKADNTIMTSSERLTLQASLNNGNSTPPANKHVYNDLTMMYPLTLYGPGAICSGSPQEFTVNHWNVDFAWDKSSNLTLSGSGSSIWVTGISNGDGWVSINWKGIELKRWSIWVGPPSGVSIYCPVSSVPAGGTVSFYASLHYSVTSAISWSVSPTSGVILTPFGTTGKIYFSSAAANTTYYVTASGSNPYGSTSDTYYIDIGSYSGEWGEIDAK